MRSIRLLVLLALLLSPAEHALAGVIRGRVVLVRGAAAGRPQPGVGETVVWVEQVPDRVERKLAGGGGFLWFRRAPANTPLRVVQDRERYRPRVLATTVGRPVAFLNLDRIYHNVFSVSAASSFDLGKRAPGRADTMVFARAGVVNVHCDIHPDEIGFVVVAPNHALARPDSLGRFALPKLPPGSYTVHAWHPRRGEIRRPVDVPKRGDVALDLGF